MARPKLDIDAGQVERLASIGCTVAEIAAVMDCDKRTLERRFAAVIEKGRESGRMSLRRKQWAVAMGRPANGDDPGEKPNPTMLIWLGKQMLGQTDKLESKTETRHAETMSDLPDETLIHIATTGGSRNGAAAKA